LLATGPPQTSRSPVVGPPENPFWAGGRESLPLGVALIPGGFAFGFSAGAVGLPWWAATLMSLLVYSSAAQFLGIALLASGASSLAIVITTIVANLKYALFGAVLAPQLRDAPTRGLLLASQGLADGNFALAQQRIANNPGHTRTDRYLFGGYLTAVVFWVPSTLAGVLVGDGLPGALQYGLAMGAPALFIAFLTPLMRDLTAALVVTTVAVVTLAGNELLPAGAGAILGILGGATLGGVIRWKRDPFSS
jgi:4-azaleucine resistance transporter AzlC